MSGWICVSETNLSRDAASRSTDWEALSYSSYVNALHGQCAWGKI